MTSDITIERVRVWCVDCQRACRVIGGNKMAMLIDDVEYLLACADELMAIRGPRVDARCAQAAWRCGCCRVAMGEKHDGWCAWAKENVDARAGMTVDEMEMNWLAARSEGRWETAEEMYKRLLVMGNAIRDVIAAEVKPECKCDMAIGHAPDCLWMKWKRTQT